MAVKTVTGLLTDAGGAPIPYDVIIVRLSAEAIITATQEVSTRSIETMTASDGSWSISLQANADLTPTTTYYTITAGASWARTIIVPPSAGPFVVEDLIQDPPAVTLDSRLFGTIWMGPPTGDDDSDRTQGAIARLGAYGGGELIMDDGIYGMPSALTNPYNNVLIQGYGGDWSRTGGIVPATTFKALAAGITILKIAPPVAGSCGSGGGVVGIGFDENSLAATCLEILSWRHATLDWLNYKHVSGVGLHIGVSSNASWTSADSRSIQHLKVSNQVCYNATGSGHGIVLDGDTTVLTHAGNASIIELHNVAINHLNGDAFHLGNSDNLKFYNTQTFRHGGGTGWAWFFGGGASNGLQSRAHALFGATMGGSGGTAWKIEGTDTAPQAAGPVVIYDFDKDNSSPNPTLGTGASYAYIDTSKISAGFKSYAQDETGALQLTGALLHAVGVPSNANGSNNDWAYSDNGHVYFKAAGSWTQKV